LDIPEAEDMPEAGPIRRIPEDAMAVIFQMLLDSEIYPDSPIAESHMALRITQICRQFRAMGRNLNRWRALTIDSGPSEPSQLLQDTRGAPLIIRVAFKDADSDLIPRTMPLVIRHFHHIAELRLYLSSGLLERAVGYLNCISAPVLQSLVIGVAGENLTGPLGWAPPSGLLNWDARFFPKLRHMGLHRFSPQLADAVWGMLRSLVLAQMSPAWYLFTYLQVMDMSPSLESLQIAGRLLPGTLPPPFLEASWLKSLHLSECWSDDVNLFIRHVKLPMLDDLTIAPVKCDDNESFFNMLMVDGDDLYTICAFAQVGHIEVGFVGSEDERSAVLTCRLLHEEGVFTISLPVAHSTVFDFVVDLFPHLEAFTVLDVSDDLEWDFGVSHTVRNVWIKGLQHFLLPAMSPTFRKCFPNVSSINSC
jgi:hypothetical protein